ncbi:papain-like cysteine protease family protein [Duganella vulcania]|uniref:Uncharacterized protein n=1 Tax=Duganella vulcania TaxID=2692166 RepID=A0A845GFU5_9BURK|nr:papain-like cysteine protease family protein [Duganella vulcania]MYM92245.1 hypothetical protein [Duganella vulcania]
MSVLLNVAYSKGLGEYTCLFDSLSMIRAYFGQATFLNPKFDFFQGVKMDQIDDVLEAYTPQNKTLCGKLNKFAIDPPKEKYNLAGLEQLLQQCGPLIGVTPPKVNWGHCCVIIGASPWGVTYHDPALGPSKNILFHKFSQKFPGLFWFA